MTTFALYLILLKAMVTSFSGFGSLPQARQDLVVTHRAIGDDALNRAVLIGRTTPGPIGVYVVSVGYEVAGWRGAIAGWLAMVTPALLVIPVYGVAVRVAAHRRAQSAIGALVLASAVLVVFAGVPLALEVLSRWRMIFGM